MKEVGLSIGSNRGDRMAFLSKVRRSLEASEGMRVVAASSVYETEPIDTEKEYIKYKYLNAVLIVETKWTPGQIHQKTKLMEEEMGRKHERKVNMPRLIDIDVLYVGTESVDTPALTVPHPRWHGREFVIRPLAEVRPDTHIPGIDETPAQLLATLDSQGVRKVCEPSDW